MQIGNFEFPDGLYYDKLHSWAKAEGDVITQGLTPLCPWNRAKEIVFVEAPRAGRDVEQGQTFMSMESGKWVGRIAALASGKIPALVNESPFDEGWLVKIKMADPAELDSLMKAGSPELKAFIEEEAEKYKDILG